jgi:transforming growth factor-beta-induced protein
LAFLLKPENSGVLGAILGYHAVIGTVLSTDLMDGMNTTSLTNQTLMISATMTGFAIEGANIGPTDLTASNGVIHVIDRVLIPPGIAFPADIVDLAVSTGQFPTLVAALGAAGLVDALKASVFTVFAPSENAFAALPPGAVGFLLRNTDLLTQVLLYHVLPGAVMAGDITDGMMAETLLEGNNVTFAVAADGSVTINDMSNVVAADIPALNGVIHVINSVLIPPSFPALPAPISEILKVPETGNFDTLLAALEATGFDVSLAGEGPFTLLAPQDDAFAALSPGTINSLLAESNFTTLKEILSYHVIPGMIVDEAAIAGGLVSATTLQGEEIVFDGLEILSSTDALNGVVLAIGSVLLPSTVSVLPGIAEVGIASGLFNIMFGAIQAVGLGGTLAVEDPLSK